MTPQLNDLVAAVKACAGDYEDKCFFDNTSRIVVAAARAFVDSLEKGEAAADKEAKVPMLCPECGLPMMDHACPISSAPNLRQALENERAQVSHLKVELEAKCEECERLRADADSFHRVMSLLKDTKCEHGLCHPRERKACTNCNARDELEELISRYKGRTIRAALAAPAKATEAK